VIETALRIPSGDARHLAYTVLLGGREATVIEVHNDSPVPVALALALRPYAVGWPPLTGGQPFPEALQLAPRSGIGSSLQRPSAVTAGGTALVVLPRSPSQAGASAQRDQLDELQVGADLTWDDPVAGPTANAVLLFPLPHRTSLRCLVPGGETVATGPRRRRWGRTRATGATSDRSGPRADPAALRPAAASVGDGRGLELLDPRSAPEVETVARGWDAVVAAGARIVLPDPGISALLEAARARLLLAAPGLGAGLARLEPGAGAILAGLALGGHRREVTSAIERLARSLHVRRPTQPLDGAEIVAALGRALSLVGDAAGGERDRLVEWATGLTRAVDRCGQLDATRMAKLGLALLVEPLDPPGAERLAAETGAGLGGDLVPPTLADVNELAAQASPAGAWGGATGDDPVTAARFVAAVRALVIADDGGTVDLLPRFPPGWRGGTVDVHDLPSRHGRLSFAVRWHGYRPALLWQLDPAGASEPASGASYGVVLRAPALDGAWQTGAARGEALLSGWADDVPVAPGPGQDFS
jgi:hypothetical protein